MKTIPSILLLFIYTKISQQGHGNFPSECETTKKEFLAGLKKANINIEEIKGDVNKTFRNSKKNYKLIVMDMIDRDKEFKKLYKRNYDESTDMYIDDEIDRVEIELTILETTQNTVRLDSYYNCWYYENKNKKKDMILIEMDFFHQTFDDLYKNDDPVTKTLFWQFDIMFKLARAVKDLHDINFFHGDIYSTNIYMRNNYLPVLGGFGNGNHIIVRDTKREFRGRYPFAAPEMHEKLIFTTSVDIYGLAGIFFQILTYNTNIIDKKDNKKYTNFDPKPNYSPLYKFYERLLGKMTLKSIKSRYNINEVISYLLKSLPKVFKLIRIQIEEKDKSKDYDIIYKDPISYFDDENYYMSKSYLAKFDNPAVEFYYEKLWRGMFVRRHLYNKYFKENYGEQSSIIDAKQFDDLNLTERKHLKFF